MDLSSLFSIGGPTQIGLDIGASSVKAVAVHRSGDKIKVLGAAYEETPPGWVINGDIKNAQGLVDVVKRTLEKAGIKSYKGVCTNVGLRGVGVVFRRIMLPLRTEDDMANQILMEAQQHIESDLGEWIIDHQVLTPPNAGGLVAVMLVGAKRVIAEDFQNLVNATGLKPGVFDCDIFSMVNAYEHSVGGNIGETVLFLDIGHDTANFHLVQDNIPIIVRSFSCSGSRLTEMINESAKVESQSQAEILKLSASSSNDGGVQKEVLTAFENYANTFAKEVDDTLKFFSNNNNDVKIDAVDRIVLCGGGANAKRLAATLKAKWHNAQVEFMDPFRNATMSQKAIDSIGDMPHIYSVAFGLALRKPGDNAQ